MSFDRQRFQSLLGTPNHAYLQLSFHIFETLSSTNQKLWELIEEGAAPGTVALACQQTGGRGQWGRQWYSPRGGLYLSLALAPNIPAANSAQLTLCTAWGIATALRLSGIPILLKWPNDLVLLGRKLGGILTETRVQQGQITKAVVGVGINWANPVPETGINLQSFLQITCLEMLAAIVLNGILSGYQRCKAEGIDALVLSYLDLLHNRDRTVLWNGRPVVVLGVTPTGELRVQLVGTTSEISLQPGTISFGYEKIAID